MDIEQDTQPEKVCIVCGAELRGRQTKFCSEEHRVWYHNNKNGTKKREYYKSYMSGYRGDKRKDKYCFYCGLKLGKYKKKFCNRSHRELYYKGEKKLHEDVVKDGRLPIFIPEYCDECGSKIVLERDGEHVCRKCGLVY